MRPGEGVYVFEIKDGMIFGETAGDKLDTLIKQKMVKSPDMNYSEACTKVLEENTKLTQEYMGEIHTRGYARGGVE